MDLLVENWRLFFPTMSQSHPKACKVLSHPQLPLQLVLPFEAPSERPADLAELWSPLSSASQFLQKPSFSGTVKKVHSWRWLCFWSEPLINRACWQNQKYGQLDIEYDSRLQQYPEHWGIPLYLIPSNSFLKPTCSARPCSSYSLPHCN